MTEEWLTKERAIHRDEGGNILPAVETVEFMEDTPKIKVLPLTRGELQSLDAGKEETEQDKKIIKKYLLLPKLDDKDIELMTVKDISAIIWAIMAASTGMSQTSFKEKQESYLKETEAWLKKKANPTDKTPTSSSTTTGTA